MKIGELADKANVTKRTIDYYTRLGLLKAERSASNYRYYDCHAEAQIYFIEKRKAAGLSLEEIKKELLLQSDEQPETTLLKRKMQSLDKELSEMLALLNETDAAQLAKAKKAIAPASRSLIKTLLMLLP